MMILEKSVVLLAAVTITTAQLVATNPDCDFIYSVLFGQNVIITSPEWPKSYSHDQICRWVLICPTGYNCHLKCNFVSLPVAEDCEMDKLLVSPAGNMLLYGADIYCGRTVIDTMSIGSRLTMGLLSSPGSSGGKFRCTVSAELH